MENLTSSYGFVISNVPASPRYGYTVVVFEEVQGGMAFRKELNPGDPPYPPKKLFRWPKPNLLCFAVKQGDGLKHKFSSDALLTPQCDHVMLNYRVSFSIRDALSLISRYKDDPILLLQNEIKEKIEKNIQDSGITIDDVINNFFGLQDIIKPDHTLEKLRHYATGLGITLEDIELSHTLPEPIVEKLRGDSPTVVHKTIQRMNSDHFIKRHEKVLEKELEEELKDILENRAVKRSAVLRDDEFEYEKMKSIFDLQHNGKAKMQGILMETLRKFPAAIDNVIKGIDGPDSFTKSMEAILIQVEKLSSNILGPGGNPMGLGFGEPTGEEHNQEASSESSPLEEARIFFRVVLEKVSKETPNMSYNNDFLSCVALLLGEIYRKERADLESIKKNIEVFKNLFPKFAQLFSKEVAQQGFEYIESLPGLIKEAQSKGEEHVG